MYTYAFDHCSGMRAALVFLLLSFAVTTGPRALFAGDRSATERLSDDAAFFFEDFRHVFSSPARFDGGEWATVAAVAAAATAAAVWVDEPLRESALGRRTPVLDALSPVGDRYGELSSGYYLGSALYLAGTLADDEWTRLTGRAVIEAHTFSLMITGVLKAVAGRSRPYRNEGNMRFNWFETTGSRWSLPSGHTTAAFAISSVLHRRIDRPWVSAGLYLLSGVTVMNRIYEDKHWLSDTVLGAAIGTAVGLAVGDLVEKEEEERKKGGLEALRERPVDLIRFSVSF